MARIAGGSMPLKRPAFAPPAVAGAPPRPGAGTILVLAGFKSPEGVNL